MAMKWHIDPEGNVDDTAMVFVEELKALTLSVTQKPRSRSALVLTIPPRFDCMRTSI